LVKLRCFFQAEYGIRGPLVTGVQTCALPIWRRSPATLPGYHRGRPPRNKGLRYPPDPPTVEEIIAVMRAAGDDPDGVRLRGVIRSEERRVGKEGRCLWAWRTPYGDEDTGGVR